MEQDSNIKRYSFEYEDDEDGSLIYEKSNEGQEKIKITSFEGNQYLTGNKKGLELLGKILIQMSQGDFENGCHFHLRENFGEHSNESICINLEWFVFNININTESGEVDVTGSHDGYPSYKVDINGKNIYDAPQNNLFDLIGDGDDVKVNVNTKSK